MDPRHCWRCVSFEISIFVGALKNADGFLRDSSDSQISRFQDVCSVLEDSCEKLLRSAPWFCWIYKNSWDLFGRLHKIFYRPIGLIEFFFLYFSFSAFSFLSIFFPFYFIHFFVQFRFFFFFFFQSVCFLQINCWWLVDLGNLARHGRILEILATRPHSSGLQRVIVTGTGTTCDQRRRRRRKRRRERRRGSMDVFFTWSSLRASQRSS